MKDKVSLDAERSKLQARFDRLQGMSQAKFAQIYRVPGGGNMVTHHLKGRRPINLAAAKAYARGFNCPLAAISPRLAALFASVAPVPPPALNLTMEAAGVAFLLNQIEDSAVRHRAARAASDSVYELLQSPLEPLAADCGPVAQSPGPWRARLALVDRRQTH